MRKLIFAASALVLATAPLAAQTPAPTATANPTPVNFISAQSQTEVLGTDFVGTNVYSKSGEKLGDIVNLVFDQTGRLATAVIGVGGFLGVGQKEVAVPFDSLTSDLRDNKHVLVLDATKDQLKAAPAFKTLNDQAFNQRISDWRGKATESWNQLKNRASQAYDSAKTTVRDQSQKAADAVRDGSQRANDAVNTPSTQPATPASPTPAPAQ
jgi:sporulation protein YlmC with PRC-barrel domain